MIKKYNLEICGNYRTGQTNIDSTYVQSVDEAITFAKKVGFPEHGIIIKKRNRIYKNITTEQELVATVGHLLSGFFTKKVLLETDMRAHKNPSRRIAIEQATLHLIQMMQSFCPRCGIPGFGVKEYSKTSKCSCCGFPTEFPTHEIYQCQSCAHSEIKPIDSQELFTDPMYCSRCNP